MLTLVLGFWHVDVSIVAQISGVSGIPCVVGRNLNWNGYHSVRSIPLKRYNIQVEELKTKGIVNVGERKWPC